MKKLSGLLVSVFLLSLAASAASPAALLSSGHIDEAMAALQSRLATSPQDAEAHHLLARAYYAVERWDDAVASGEKAVALSPRESDYHLWLGRFYGSKAEHSGPFTAARMAGRARTEFEKAVALNAFNAAARADLAEFYLEAPGIMGGGKDKALAQAQRLDSLNKSAALWLRARLAEKDGKTADAERFFREAVTAASGAGEQYLNLASFYARQKRFNQMEEAINQAVAAAQSAEKPQPSVLVDAASLLFRNGRNFSGAVSCLRKYLAGDKQEEQAPAFRAHYLLGSILEKQGDRTTAIAEYRAALALARDYRPAGDALARLGAKP